jgi:hypothetical protein
VYKSLLIINGMKTSLLQQANKQTHKQEVVTGGCKFKIMRGGLLSGALNVTFLVHFIYLLLW